VKTRVKRSEIKLILPRDSAVNL